MKQPFSEFHCPNRARLSSEDTQGKTGTMAALQLAIYLLH